MSRLVFVGDVHALFSEFRDVLRRMPVSDTVIQVGDFGLFPANSGRARTALADERHFFYTHGNHEWMPWYVPDATVSDPAMPGWAIDRYVQSGTVLMTAGRRRVGFLGGGESTDRAYRTPGFDWWPTERVSEQAVEKLIKHGSVDVLVTHCPPTPANRAWGYGPLPQMPVDHSGDLVLQAWGELGKPPLVCGHMHPDTVLSYETVRCLPELGAYSYEDLFTR